MYKLNNIITSFASTGFCVAVAAIIKLKRLKGLGKMCYIKRKGGGRILTRKNTRIRKKNKRGKK